MALDNSKPVRITASGLKANPAFAGLVGTVVVPQRPGALGVAVYFPERGATTIWFADEVENLPDDRRRAHCPHGVVPQHCADCSEGGGAGA